MSSKAHECAKSNQRFTAVPDGARCSDRLLFRDRLGTSRSQILNVQSNDNFKLLLKQIISISAIFA